MQVLYTWLGQVPDIDNQQLNMRLHFLKLGQLLRACEAGEAYHPLTAEDLLSGAAIAPATPDRMLVWEPISLCAHNPGIHSL